MSLKVLVLTNDPINDLNVQYTTDIVDANQDNFTVLAISGLTDAAKHAGVPTKQQVYSLSEFKTFAIHNNFKLVLLTADSSTTLVDTDTSDSFSLTIDEIVNVPSNNGQY